MQLTDPHLTTPTPYTPPALVQNDAQHELRVLVDEVATTRGLTLQMSMRTLTFSMAPDAAARQAVCAEFDVMRTHFKQNLELVFGQKKIPDSNREHVALLRNAAARDPQRAPKMAQVAAMADAMSERMNAGATIDRAQTTNFFESCWPIARDTMTEVIWDVWAQIDADRNADLQTAHNAADALSKRLTRLEQIGKHVRLVSLNASVEASRAGDVGKGLMVIAQEFKSLAEEIQQLAQSARADMDEFS